MSDPLIVLTNDGSGGFNISSLLPTGNSLYWYAAPDVNGDVADVNGDVKPDLIAANANDNSLTVFTNDGSGNDEGVWISNNSGATWRASGQLISQFFEWTVASSADGTRLVVGGQHSRVNISALTTEGGSDHHDWHHWLHYRRPEHRARIAIHRQQPVPAHQLRRKHPRLLRCNMKTLEWKLTVGSWKLGNFECGDKSRLSPALVGRVTPCAPVFADGHHEITTRRGLMRPTCIALGSSFSIHPSAFGRKANIPLTGIRSPAAAAPARTASIP